jgi:hypothetical protein
VSKANTGPPLKLNFGFYISFGLGASLVLYLLTLKPDPEYVKELRTLHETKVEARALDEARSAEFTSKPRA